MPILSNGQTVTDEQAKSITDYFSTNPNANQIAERAASLGLTKDQLASAAGYANFGTNQAANIDSYLTNNTSGYTAGANGVITASAKPPAQGAASDTMQIGGHTLTRKQLQEFYAGGGNDGQTIYQQGGITDPAEINRLSMEARKFAGNMPTGDAALQMYFKQYQQSTPNGFSAKNFDTWLAGLVPGHEGAMRAGGFTGLAYDTRDNGFGAIHGPGSAWYENKYGTNHPYYNNNETGGSSGAGGGGIIGSIGDNRVINGAGGGGTGYSSGGSSSSFSTSSGGTAPWNVTPDQTVEGRINGILNPNNPIIQQARTGALEQMNARGMLNSSLATTASDAAAYQAAIPIAAADAATAAKAAGYNADQKNQFTQADLNRATQVQLANINADTQKYLAGLDITQKNQAQALQLKNATLLNTNSQAAQVFNTGMGAINAIANNPQMDANTKTRASANVWRDVQGQLKVLETTSGLNLSSQLNFAGYPGFNDKGNWVGFPDGPATTPPGAIPPTSPVIERDGGGSA